MQVEMIMIEITSRPRNVEDDADADADADEHVGDINATRVNRAPLWPFHPISI